MNSYTPIYPEDYDCAVIVLFQANVPDDVYRACNAVLMAYESNELALGMDIEKIQSYFRDCVRSHNLNSGGSCCV